MNRTILHAVILWAAGAAVSAYAHHSFAAYDMTRVVTVTGTVREFQWVNPHIQIYVSARDDKGVTQDVGVEGSAVVALKREGWSKDSFKAGDKVTISFHPRKDGTPGGAFLQAVTASGQTLGSPDKQLTTPTAPAQAGGGAAPQK